MNIIYSCHHIYASKTNANVGIFANMFTRYGATLAFIIDQKMPVL